MILPHPGIKVVVQTTLQKEINNGVVGTAGSKSHRCLSSIWILDLNKRLSRCTRRGPARRDTNIRGNDGADRLKV
jgi:hypothetical protein